jgi:uncharacterized membrane protein YphA (DoxX/SURF4 family)
MMQSAPFNYRRIIIWIGRIVLAAIFIYAGYAKLFRPDMTPRPQLPIAISLFALQIDSYQILPPPAVLFVARTLPFAEIVLGLLLLSGWQLRLWSALVTLIIAGFFASVVRAYSMGLQINCGCFAKPEPLTIVTIFRDGALLLLAILMTVFVFQEAAKPHPWNPSTPERSV